MTTKLIRWNDGHAVSTGQFGPFTFVVSRVYSGGKFLLVAYIPGMEDRRARGDLAEVKATAESWLREFVSSLGAVFAADLREHLDEQIGIEKDLGDDYSETPGESALEQAHRHYGRVEACWDLIKWLDRELETPQLGEADGPHGHLAEEDLRVDIYRTGVNCHVAVRITHLPTGLSATAEARSGLQAKAEALARIRELVAGRPDG